MVPRPQISQLVPMPSLHWSKEEELRGTLSSESGALSLLSFHFRVSITAPVCGRHHHNQNTLPSVHSLHCSSSQDWLIRGTSKMKPIWQHGYRKYNNHPSWNSRDQIMLVHHSWLLLIYYSNLSTLLSKPSDSPPHFHPVQEEGRRKRKKPSKLCTVLQS